MNVREVIIFLFGFGVGAFVCAWKLRGALDELVAEIEARAEKSGK